MPSRLKKSEKAGDLVPALGQALRVIELISSRPGGVGLSEIAATLGIPKNLAFRITQTLLAHAYLGRDEKSLFFYITSKFLELGFRARGETDLVGLSIDVMKALRDACGETVLLGALDGDHGLVLHQVAGSHPFRFWVEPGTRLPLHASAPGKAILACLPDAERKDLLGRLDYKPYNRRTLASRKSLEAALPETFERGWALDDGEMLDGVRCVAAAIRDPHGYPVGAIWFTGPKERLADGQLAAQGAVVVQHARTISLRLGHGYFDADGQTMGVAS